MRWTLIFLAVACLAAAPSDKYNLPVQRRTRDVVQMKRDLIPLRFSDGTTTGYFYRADDPSKDTDCPAGSIDIDAHETLTTATGMKLYFHAGGGHYNDRINNGQYGHVAADDLKSLPRTKPTGNGAAAPLSPITYFIEPTRIPDDMFYKPNADAAGRTGSTYYTYGNPGYDKTEGRGDWTYINWSWVQNGRGAKFPENKCNGGGMVRALAKRDQLFTAADVTPILGYSYGKDNEVNGRVTAFYGKTTTGPGEKGQPVFGWLPHSYQKNNDIIVPCVRRANANGANAFSKSKSSDRLERMAINLFSPLKSDDDAKKFRADFLKRIAAESDMIARCELITDLSRFDDADTVALLLKVLAQETHPIVREQTIAILGFMGSTPAQMKTVVPALIDEYRRSSDLRLRLRALDVVSNIPAPESSEFLNAAHAAITHGDEEGFALADALFKLSARTKVDPALINKVTDELKATAKSAPTPEARLRATHILTAPGRGD